SPSFAKPGPACQRTSQNCDKSLSYPTGGAPQLLHGHALGEITRLVDVAAELDGEMIGEELEGDDGQDRADEIGDFGNGDDVVGNSFKLFRAIPGGDGDDGAFAGADLFDVVQILGEDSVVRRDENGR